MKRLRPALARRPSVFPAASASEAASVLMTRRSSMPADPPVAERAAGAATVAPEGRAETRPGAMQRDSSPLETAAALLAAGDLHAAERSLESVLSRHEDADALHLLGVVRAHQKRFQEAAQLLARAIQLKPSDPQILLNLGQTLSL